MRQKDKVMNYIQKYGSISSYEAFADLGITRLASVVFDLKKDGVQFDTVDETSVNRYGEKSTHARYSLHKESKEA